MSHMKMMMKRMWMSMSKRLYITCKTCPSCFGGLDFVPYGDGKSHAPNTNHAMPAEEPAPACSNGAFPSGLTGMSEAWVNDICQ